MRGAIERTPETIELVTRITGPADLEHHPERLILDDGACRRINGRYIVGNVIVLDEDGGLMTYRDEDGHRALVTRRRRFRIPAGHPWRGKRP